MPNPTGNYGFYEIGLLTVENEIAHDDQVQVRFFAATSPNTDLVNAHDLTFPPAHRFEVPAFPQAANLIAEINAPRFRIRRSGTFTLANGEFKSLKVIAFRQPTMWTSEFVLWNALPNEFDSLKEVLRNSPNLKFSGGTSVDLFSGDLYDKTLSAKDTLAKTSLLNLYTKLSLTIEPTQREKPWFSFVQKIIEIGRERFIAIVAPEIGQIVRTIKNNISEFKEYKNTPAANHYGNIPADYRVAKSDMFSIKTVDTNGNLQITLAPAISSDGDAVMLLDADIDENGGLMKHLADVFKHKFTGGTHPFDIHEYLALAYPNEPLGYSLV